MSPLVCTTCGAEVVEGSRFCQTCGHDLRSGVGELSSIRGYSLPRKSVWLMVFLSLVT